MRGSYSKKAYGLVIALAGFLGCQAFEPLPLQWRGETGAAVRAVADGIAVDFQEAGFDHRAEAVVTSPVRLDGHPYLVISVRNTGAGAARFAFWLQRRLDGEDNAYVTWLDVTQEWRQVDVYLANGNGYSEDGTLGYWNDLPGRNPDLALGGELVKLAVFANTAPASVEVKIEGFADSKPKPENEELRNICERQSRTLPYRFREVNPDVRIELASDGKSAWSIAIPADADPTVRFAAEELARYLERSTHATFPIVEEPTANTPVIRLSAGDAGLEDGFTGYGSASEIELSGASPRGLLFAVYDFLEKAVGVRWYMPFPCGEVVPEHRTLAVPGFADESVPFFQIRRNHHCHGGDGKDARAYRFAVADWSVKSRYNVVIGDLASNEQEHPEEMQTFYRKRGNPLYMPDIPAHNYHTLVPPARYGKDHPEYFSFNRKTNSRQVENSQLCVTNPELQALLAQKADEYFTAHPDEPLFPLFQEDGLNRWCQCPECETLAPSNDSALTGASERNIYLANRVCALIREKRPDKGVVTFAYSYTAPLPKTIRPEPGVTVLYCYDSGTLGKEVWDAKRLESLLDWSRIADGRLMVYTYQHLNPNYQMNTPDSLAAIYRILAHLGIRACIQETDGNWGGSGAVLAYMAPRLAWDPYLDEEALLRDYYSGMFGAAGAAIREYQELFTAALECVPGNQVYVGWHFFPNYSDELLARLDALLVRAETAAAGDARVAEAVAAQRAYFEMYRVMAEEARKYAAFYLHPDAQTLAAADAGWARLQEVAAPLWDAHLLATAWSGRRMQSYWQEYLHEIYLKRAPVPAQ